MIQAIASSVNILLDLCSNELPCLSLCFKCNFIVYVYQTTVAQGSFRVERVTNGLLHKSMGWIIKHCIQCLIVHSSFLFIYFFQWTTSNLFCLGTTRYNYCWCTHLQLQVRAWAFNQSSSQTSLHQQTSHQNMIQQRLQSNLSQFMPRSVYHNSLSTILCIQNKK